jgi:hypothetical protein
MNRKVRARTGLCIVFCFCSIAGAAARGQEERPLLSNIPTRDPGYVLFFHDADNAPNIAYRWGYHEGWLDGRKARDLGVMDVASDQQPKYMTPPEHERPAGVTRMQYMRDYRNAYQRGYIQGTR